MEGRKEEYHGHDPSSQAAFPNSPYFESLLQGISVSTSAASSSGVNDDNLQSWSSAFLNPYPSYSNWSGHAFSDIFPVDSSRHAFNVASHGGIASNIPGYEELFHSESNPIDTDTSNPLTSPFTGFGGLDINEFRNASDASLESSTESVNRQQNYVTKTYDPFGTVPVFCRDSEDNDTIDHSPTLARSSSPSLSKPTYSDVAKNKPKLSASASSSKLKEPKSVPELATPAAYLKVPYKKSKPNRGHLNKPKHAADGSVVKPDSKYGLDSFEEPSKILMDRTKRQHSLSGSDSMPPSRKGSTSSIGSASSGLDEFCMKGGLIDTKTSPDLERKIQETKAKKLPSSSATFSADSDTKRKKSKKSAMPGSGPKEEKTFFDPKLIFQSKPKISHKIPETVPNNQQQGGPMSGSELLNNGKPKSNLCNSNFDKSSSTHYINNDLGHGKKQTNMNTHRVGQDKSKTSNMDSEDSSCAAASERSDVPDHANIFRRKLDNNNQGRKTESKTPNTSSRKTKKSKEEPNAIRELATLTYEWTQWMFKELFHILQNVVLLIFKCAVLLFLLLGQYILDLVLSFWNFVKSRLPGFRNRSKEDWSNSSSQNRLRSQGLEENITLPTTGEEAMKRLLACKGKDPFSILGVRTDSSDEQIKKYYRKQAVLVHPDKNQQPGAEEAFKILGHAFELIGEPEKRQKYREARETEAAMQEFADLLSKLHDKMQEAANTMRCDNCGGKHTRVSTDRPFYSARYCDRCNTRHAAKEGDVWAESSVLGFLWHYYACMEGKIYDITEWASCQNTHFKHIQANAHQVIYRIATSANKRHNTQRTNEADLEDFFNHLFQRGNRTEGDQPEGFNYGTGAGTQQNPSAAGAWNAAGRQQKKKKKKRH